MQLPDAGANINADDRKKFRRAIYAGLMTSSSGTMGTPTVAKPTFGG